jgi:hypothetical protein
MDDNKKQLVPSIVVASAILLLIGVLLFQGKPVANVTVAPQGTPVVVSGPSTQDVQDRSFGATPASQTTNWTGGSFSGDLSVGGALSITGTTTFTGDTAGAVKAVVGSMSSSATTTACDFVNTSAINRVVLSAGVVDRGTAASLGSVAWVAGTSTYAGVMPVTTGKVVNTALTRANGVDAITTTSTLQTAYSTWNTGEHFVVISSTTTNAGTCRLTYIGS